jgi:hypothetical protein
MSLPGMRTASLRSKRSQLKLSAVGAIKRPLRQQLQESSLNEVFVLLPSGVGTDRGQIPNPRSVQRLSQSRTRGQSKMNNGVPPRLFSSFFVEIPTPRAPSKTRHGWRLVTPELAARARTGDQPPRFASPATGQVQFNETHKPVSPDRDEAREASS